MDTTLLDIPPQARRAPRRLEGRVALVTGAGSIGTGFGTGRAMALLFALEGASVAVMDNRRDSAEETVALIAREGGRAKAVIGDITSGEDCARVVAESLAAFGRLDILVNNVGTAVKGPVTAISEADWDRVFAINVKAMFLLARAAMPALAAHGNGAIINISSVGARRPADIAAYTASKGAVESLTLAMAHDHGPQGVRVNCIAPGPLFTPRQQVNRQLSDEQRAYRAKLSMVEREGTAFDVAWAAVFLASDEARYITAAVLPVDGGVGVKAAPFR